VQDIAYR